MSTPEGYTVHFPKLDGPPGDHGSIAFKEKHWKSFQKDVIAETRAKLHATMLAWCRVGPANLPPQKFVFETQFKRDGKSTRIEAFKGWQVRLYGTCMNVKGKPMFLVTGMDIAKKQDKADPEKLDAAGKAAHALIHPANRQKK